MFSPELENLIQATLEDGILEDKEKAALIKRAQAEGVDIAELEIYINLAEAQERGRQRKKCKDGADSPKEEKGSAHMSKLRCIITCYGDFMS